MQRLASVNQGLWHARSNQVFEDPQDRVMCLFGPNWCGVGPNCPLHNSLLEMHQKALDRLDHETFQQFIGHPH